VKGENDIINLEMKKEAILYERIEDKKVKCDVCQRRCVIPDGKTGWCRTRVNDGGILYSLIYGEVSSTSINPIEKNLYSISILEANGYPSEVSDVISGAPDARTGISHTGWKG